MLKGEGAENKVGEGGLFLFGSIIPHLRFVFVSCANDSIGHLGRASAFLLFLPLQEPSLCKRALPSPLFSRVYLFKCEKWEKGV